MNYESFNNEFYILYPKLVRTTSFICIKKQDAINISKESMVDAYVNWKKFSDSTEALFFGKANAIKKIFDKNKSDVETSDKHINLTLIEDLEKNVIHFSSPQILEALFNLPLKERIAITLSYIDQESENTISKLMGIKLVEAKSLLKNASDILEFQLRTS
ncbi:MAG: hypothetical protein U0R17_02490 [Acidimicrobiia bacterium]